MGDAFNERKTELLKNRAHGKVETHGIARNGLHSEMAAGFLHSQQGRACTIAFAAYIRVLQDDTEFTALLFGMDALKLEASDNPRAEKDAVMCVIRPVPVIIIMVRARHHLVGINKGMEIKRWIRLIITEKRVILLLSLRPQQKWFSQRILDLPFIIGL